ncbi:Uncharacterised protein [Klebsiella pneumoniae]|nr:Uncharacterised protein [Klebsiella pneumoniae]
MRVIFSIAKFKSLIRLQLKRCAHGQQRLKNTLDR